MATVLGIRNFERRRTHLELFYLKLHLTPIGLRGAKINLHSGDVTFFVCRIDGTQIGEFDEAQFREKVFGRQIASDDYYWHEGMAEWRPVAEYRALAKTQRISFTPPPRPTVKIEVDQVPASSQRSPKRANPISRFLERIRRKL